MEAAAKELLDILNSQEGIKNQYSLNVLELKVNNYIKLLPQTITLATYTEINNQEVGDDFLYGRIVGGLLKFMNDNYALNNEEALNLVQKLLVVNGCTANMIVELFEAIDDCLKEVNNDRTINLMNMMLERIIKSDAIYSGIVHACKPNAMHSIAEEEFFQNWRRFLQVLVSLPSRVANKMKGKINDIFMPETYAKVITYHVVRAVSFVNDALYEFFITPRFNILSAMISKVVLALGADKFIPLIEILVGLVHNDRCRIRNFIYNILILLEGPSTEAIAVLVLKTIKNPAKTVEFFQDLISSSHWKHVLTTKIPMLSYYNNDSLIVNLIFYLGSPQYGRRALNDLLIRLMDIWGDRSALNHTSLEQHEYITKLILLSVKILKDTLKPTDKDVIQRLLFEGTAAHLESMQVEMRAIGMITGELIVEFLNGECDAPKLLYEYDSMPMDGLKIVERLKIFVNNVHENILPETENDADISSCNDGTLQNNVDKKIHGLAIQCGILQTDNEDSPKISGEVRAEAQNQAETKLSDNETCVNDEENNSDDLDSDDDLIPYDMSNDVKTTEKLRPIYLRDLKENLLNVGSSKDPNIFSESLQAAEKLILSQLSNDDSSLAIELLEILTTLQEIVCVENFELLKFQSCVAIVTVYPKQCAKYLCKEFHAEIGQHSMNDRIFILNVLAEASKRLSKINLDENVDAKMESGGALQKTKRPGRPISLFIDVNNGKRYETLYDEDFEVPITSGETGRSNWEEIVQQRIHSNTRIFAHESKRSSKTINKFNDVVSSFFYPLLYGLSQKSAYLYKIPKSYSDQDNILLIHFLKTLSTIMVSAENCVIAPKIALEILELAWTLRYHEQANVRLCVIQNIASVIVSLTNETFTTEIVELLLEFRTWLFDSSEDSVRGDPDTKCRNLGKNVVALIDLVISSTLNNG